MEMNATDELLAPHLSTPSAEAGGGPAWRMPPDLLAQTCRRVGAAGAVFAGTWMIVLLMQNVAWRLFPTGAVDSGAYGMVWPMPGNVIAAAGVALSLGLILLAGRLHDRPHLLTRRSTTPGSRT